LERLLDRGIIRGPCLELGAGIPEHSAKAVLAKRGIDYVGTDLAGEVDVIADFTERASVSHAFVGRRFATALLFNVLEHTFDPIRVLDNVFELIADSGICVVLTPTVWPIHSYPMDCWRILPDFYVEYAMRRRHELLWDTFEFVGHRPIVRRGDRCFELPKPGRSPLHGYYSRAVHKLLNTAGRGMLMPSHVATAVAIRKALPAAG
jgi:hypothetical protein